MIRATLVALIAAAGLSAQQPVIENAKVDTHPFAAALATQLAQFGAGPFWAGYSEPTGPGRQEYCQGYGTNAPVRLEGDTALVVLVRIEDSHVDKLRISSPDCKLDGGGLPFHWIENVPADASVAWLKSQISGDRAEQAIFALAQHTGPAADRALEDLTAPTQTEKVRERTAFWLGTSRGAKGIEILKRMLASDPSDKVREQAVFGLAQSKDPAGIKTVIEAARSDRSARIRERALFWLAQKASDQQATAVISNAVLNDPDRAVKESAVFALQQLPPERGIPLLINVAKTNTDPAVRKKAMFWLGQSSDPRALEFIASVLK